MNVDILTLTAAVHNINVANTELSTVSKSDTPRKMRRRSSHSGGTKQFLEAAHQSWTFGLEDLPEETPALQKRRSSRSNLNVINEAAHKSLTLTSCEYGEATPEKESSSRTPRPSTLKQRSSRRRASLSGGFVSRSPQDNPVDSPVKTEGRLARRSSLHVVSTKKNSPVEKDSRVVRRSSDPTPIASKKSHGKMARRSTIGSISAGDVSPLVRGTKKTRRPSQKNGLAGKGSVRFELDHKNRIKRNVHYIRSQASRKPASALWWSEEDLERIYERENRVYEKFSTDRKYKKSIRQLWGSCSKAAKVPLSAETITHVAGSPSRGLEVDILETVRDRRVRVIKSVLDAQDTLLDFDPTLRSKVLGARYKNLCRSAVRFARKLAEGDELEAGNVYSN